MKYLFITVTFLSLIACGSKSNPSVPGGIDLSGFQMSEIDGSETQYGLLQLEDGKFSAEGMVKNGIQDGMWITYFADEENKINTIVNYVSGKMNGPYIELNNRSQIEKRITYLNDQVHGLYAEYKFGRPKKEYFYNNGILDGVSKDYNDRGKLIKETSYKKGQLDGDIISYDEEGTEILRYKYKNGEKVSGGIVE